MEIWTYLHKSVKCCCSWNPLGIHSGNCQSGWCTRRSHRFLGSPCIHRYLNRTISCIRTQKRVNLGSEGLFGETLPIGLPVWMSMMKPGAWLPHSSWYSTGGIRTKQLLTGIKNVGLSFFCFFFKAHWWQEWDRPHTACSKLSPRYRRSSTSSWSCWRRARSHKYRWSCGSRHSSSCLQRNQKTIMSLIKNNQIY